MGRPWREEYKGGIYHVIARGNNKEYIFKDNIDKEYFLKEVKEQKKGLEFNIFAYVLMDNHYHFLIQVFETSLQKLMHQINNKYSKYYNSKYNRVGHVFQGRYKAVLVQDERYLLSLIRYIHQNPVLAHMSSKVAEYRWSSDWYYRSNANSFINIDVPLKMLSEDRVKALKQYSAYMDEKENEDYDSKTAIGDEAYVVMCKVRKKVEQRKRLDEILIETGADDKGFAEIKNGSRKRSLTQYKLKYARAAVELKYTFKEIGSNISMTDTAIRNLLNRNE